MQNSIQSTMQAVPNTVREADQAAQQESRLAGLAALVRAGHMTLDGVQGRDRDAVRAILAGAPSGMTPQRFHARQNAERRAYWQKRSAEGFHGHRVSQADHDYVFGTILGTVDSGQKPAVKPLLQDYAQKQGYDPAWAEKVATRTQPKRMQRSLDAAQDHPVIQELQGERMLTRTHRASLKNGTYSTLAATLFAGSQIVRKQKALEAHASVQDARIAALEARLALAEARLDIKDAGMDWKEKARAILAAEPSISKRELARRCGMSEASIRKYAAELAA